MAVTFRSGTDASPWSRKDTDLSTSSAVNSVVGAYDDVAQAVVGRAHYSAEGRLMTFDTDSGSFASSDINSLDCQEIGSYDGVCAAPGGIPFALNMAVAFRSGADISPRSRKGTGLSTSSAAKRAAQLTLCGARQLPA
jgi:hypothetical protein